MLRVPSLLTLAATLALGACAVAPPSGPSVMALPPKDKSLADFQKDDMSCRQYASAQIGNISPAEGAQQSAINSAALGTVLGAAAGAAIGAAAGNPGAGAAIGAGSGLLMGSAAGANAAQYSGASLQQRYDIGYSQCMSARGNSVPSMTAGGPAGYGGGYAYPAPAPYPYAYPAPSYYYPYPYPYYGSVNIGYGWGRWRR